MLAYGIYEGFQGKEEFVIAALDLEDAYNRVDYGQLMLKLVNFEVDIFLIRWIAVALMERKVALRLGKWMSDQTEICPGLPQGSALSPVLFNVYTAELPSNQVNCSGSTMTFADDITAFERGNDRLEIAKKVQRRIQEIESWCHGNNAVMNPDKAQVLWCSLNNMIVQDPTPPITCDYEIIDRKTEMKYLGNVFDRSLSFNKHIDMSQSKQKEGSVQ